MCSNIVKKIIETDHLDLNEMSLERNIQIYPTLQFQSLLWQFQSQFLKLRNRACFKNVWNKLLLNKTISIPILNWVFIVLLRIRSVGYLFKFDSCITYARYIFYEYAFLLFFICIGIIPGNSYEFSKKYWSSFIAQDDHYEEIVRRQHKDFPC